MNLNLLESFVVLADCLHFGEAAQVLNLSQSALTKQIRRLEEILGAPLFARNRQGTELSDFGRFFLAEARPLLLQANSVLERGRRAAKGDLGRIVIGFSFSTDDHNVMVVQHFRRHFPDVDIGLHDLSSAEQMERLISGDLHVGFVRLPARTGLSSRKIISDRLALVIPAALADRIPAFDPALIRDMPFVALERERAPGLHAHIRRFSAANGLEPRIIQHANESLTVLSLVAAGIGIALMHESALRSHVEGVVARPIDDPAAGWDVGLAWRTGTADRLVLRFIDLVSAAIG